ncbi:MAG: tyrosine--tRNA ligase [Bacillota bacterium]|nr:tyrosine--tRNA ligase [Bacillota bacterium]
MKNLFETLKERGYIYQLTHEEEIKTLLNSDKPFTFYLGIDPTADSLHIGHFFALMVFRYLQDAGNKGILLIGGATGMVGDPSGKTDMRQMMTREQVAHNVAEVAEIAKKFIISEGDNAAIIVNNAEWMNGYDYIDFLRDVGIHFNVNTMLQADAYAKRIEEGGLTFLEMGYMLMQAYDFVHLNRKYGCTLEIGGSDQWGNIVAGVNLGRKLDFLAGTERLAYYGMTNPLLMTSDGKKMGKTEKGALWVAKDRTSSYDFYQYFYNVQDGDVETLLKLFTKLPLEEIKNMIEEDIVAAKKRMAYEVTKLVHGEEEANSAVDAAKAMFSGGVSDDAPLAEIAYADLEAPVEGSVKSVLVTDILALSKMAASKSEARRLITQGGVQVDGEKVQIVDQRLEVGVGSEFVLKVGKKKYLRIAIK